jgi:MYXO-CTERM domain-containing protein
MPYEAEVGAVVLSRDADDPHEFGLDLPVQRVVIPAPAMQDDSGYVGRFCADTELVFYIQSPSTTRYSDIELYAQIEAAPDGWKISWEDGFDMDYNDLVVKVNLLVPPAVGGVARFEDPGDAQRTSSSADPRAWGAVAAGVVALGAVGLLARRRRRYR